MIGRETPEGPASALDLTGAMQFDDAVTDELTIGHQLHGGEYTITSVLSAAQSSFNYEAEARDGRAMTVGEFYLADMCQRDGAEMYFNSKAERTLFRKLVKGFVNDASYLRSLDNPNVVSVTDVFEENGTAYMVSVTPPGQKLEEILKAGARRFKPFEIARMANDLFSGLIEIHAFGMLHRDISPRNIIVSDKGKAVLMADFGTFRDDKSRVSKVVSSVLRATNEHAPLEFIFEGSEQNEASDVFSLASVIHLLITGKPPIGCQNRLARIAAEEPDPYVPLAGNHDQFDPRFLGSIDRSLELLNENRMRSATEFLDCFSRKGQENKYREQQAEAIKRRPKRRGFFSSLFKAFRA